MILIIGLSLSISKKLTEKIKFKSLGQYGKCNWIRSNGLINYDTAIDWMKSHITKIQKNKSNDTVWLLEHKDIFTGGTSAKNEEIFTSQNIPIRRTGRGGQWTWHGPGQRVVYIMINLNNRKPDVRWFINCLEQTIIDTLFHYSILGFRRKGLPGVWVKGIDSGEEKLNKIAAIGIRISRWTTFHGISININPSLSAFKDIVPCGVIDAGVTSMKELGIKLSLENFDKVYAKNFNSVFDK